MRTLLAGGRVYTAAGIKKCDVIINGTTIFALTESSYYMEFDQVIRCDNFFITPGFKDVHVHFREPGFSYKETIASGTMAAAHGGYTTVCTMPNLKPAPSTLETLAVQQKRIEKDACIKVLPYGTITADQSGTGSLSKMEEMAPFVAGFSDDGKGVQPETVMKTAMMKAKELGKLIVAHCEDERFPTTDPASEYKQVERDLQLVEETGCSYHICHVSTAESVELIRQAKKKHLDVTCETAPHYLLFTEDDVKGRPSFKMNPPLRKEKDRDALRQAIVEGTVDMIATDHAPHSKEEKSGSFANSLFGIVGLETAFPVLYTRLVKTGFLSLDKLIELLSIAPAKRFGLGEFDVGNAADLSVWDLEKEYVIHSDDFFSMGKAMPYEGMRVLGENVLTLVDGEIVYKRNRKNERL